MTEKTKQSLAGLVLRTLLWAVLILPGFYASVLRFCQGLGATTHLSDPVPWGLWVWLDLVWIGLSSGGFLLCAGYFIFHLESLKPIVRPAVLTAFTGYSLAGLALIYDLGLPLRFWHPVVMWNLHSPMFEISWCLMLYFGVLALELTIPISQGLGLKSLSAFLHKFCVLLAILGALLSILHQSSFGTLFLLTPEKLTGLWYSSWLPLLFLASALCGGLGFLILELSWAEKFLNWNFPSDLVKRLGKTLWATLLIYFLLLSLDFLRLGKEKMLLENWRNSAWFGLELFLGLIFPLVLLGFKKIRESKQALRICALLAVLGLFLNRLNVCLIGFLLKNQADYFPSWEEFAIIIMLLGLGGAGFGFVSRNFPIFQNQLEPDLNRSRELKS